MICLWLFNPYFFIFKRNKEIVVVVLVGPENSVYEILKGVNRIG